MRPAHTTPMNNSKNSYAHHSFLILVLCHEVPYEFETIPSWAQVIPLTVNAL